MPKPDDVGVGAAVLVLNEEGQILLGKRKGAHRAGHWACPGGWIDRDDTSTHLAAIREVKEETDLELNCVEALCWTTEDHPELGVRTITLYHVGDFRPNPQDPESPREPRVLEPNKCEEWRWFSLHQLPDPCFPGLKEAVRKLISKQVADQAARFPG
jgi:8-oxo-dGTP diphosphatase